MELTNTEIKKSSLRDNSNSVKITNYAIKDTTFQLDSNVPQVELYVAENQTVEEVYEQYIKTQLHLLEQGNTDSIIQKINLCVQPQKVRFRPFSVRIV